jgi:hypothetical protein
MSVGSRSDRRYWISAVDMLSHGGIPAPRLEMRMGSFLCAIGRRMEPGWPLKDSQP